MVDGVSPVEAVKLIGSDALLIDVREDDEWAAGHAPEALHFPMSRLQERVGELPVDRTLVCVCHVGMRSAAVAAALNRSGWRAVNLEGGMSAWESAGLPVVDGNGDPGVIG